MNSYLKNFIIVVYLCTFALFVFLSLVFCVYMSFKLFLPSLTEESEIVFSEYQSLKYNPENEEFFFGTVTIPSKIFDGEFLFQTNENDGFFELLSPIGEEEYICTGKCYCTDEHRRSGTASSITHGVVYLLAAISSILAFEIAENYFKEKCVDELSERCSDPSSIKSEVVDCENAVDAAEKSEKSEDDELLLEEEEIWKFRCEGNCIEKDTYQSYYFDLFLGTLQFECENDEEGTGTKSEIGKNVRYLRDDMDRISELCLQMELVQDVEVKVKNEQDKDTAKEKAYKKFEPSLIHFCTSRSKTAVAEKLSPDIWSDITDTRFTGWLKGLEKKGYLDYENYKKMISDDPTVDEMCSADGFPSMCRRIPKLSDNENARDVQNDENVFVLP